MAINKAWYFAVKGINIDCSPIGTKKLINKKAPKYYKEKRAVNMIKQRKDNIDEYAVKIAEMIAVKENVVGQRSRCFCRCRAQGGNQSHV